MNQAAGPTERTLALACRSNSLEEALRFADTAAAHCTPECREAVVLAVSELSENLIKYAEPDASAQAGTIGVCVDGRRVRVRATNRVTSVADAERVSELVTKLEAAEASAQELYLARLRVLFSNPDEPRAKLGLLRMAFEGGFRLTCRFEAPELHIIAERAC